MTSTVYIAKNVYGGDGLGRLGDGRVVFVPGAWAGEQVKAEITVQKKNFVKAKLVEIIERSSERIDGGEFKNIPGCVYAELSYEAELRAKLDQLKEFFHRARLFDPEKITLEDVSTLPSTNYRNKVRYHFAKQNGQWVIGYRTEPSHEVVDVSYDPLAVKPINDKLGEIRSAVKKLLTQGPYHIRKDVERKGSVTIRWTERSGVKWWIGDAPKDSILKEITHGLSFEVPAGGFYQVNPFVGAALVKAVIDEYRKDMISGADILDLYCGVGVFGLCALSNADPSFSPRLTGVESGREAILFAQKNAKALKLDASFYAEEVVRVLKKIEIGDRTTIIADPPRGGMEPGVALHLAKSRAPRIFYVSCDPATLTRDLKVICASYEVESVRLFNMFPRTARFETLVVLKKRLR
jgi:23S rRNA (uracil1939-C5)-methyltransferase